MPDIIFIREVADVLLTKYNVSVDDVTVSLYLELVGTRRTAEATADSVHEILQKPRQAKRGAKR